MKIAIIALLLSLAALGLGSFATARTFNESHPAPPVAESQWSEVGCDNARIDVREGTKTTAGGVLWRMCAGTVCVTRGVCDCAPYNDMVQAIAANCP
jgi:hypothetical protein